MNNHVGMGTLIRVLTCMICHEMLTHFKNHAQVQVSQAAEPYMV
jgi:hypothetical protein